MRFTDLFSPCRCCPLLLVIIMLFRDALRNAFGPETGIFLLIVFVIGITSWMQTARIVRGEVLAIRSASSLPPRAASARDRAALSAGTSFPMC